MTEHFRGKSVSSHLQEAKIKGSKAFAEAHGIEMSGFISALIDTLKEGCFISAILLQLIQDRQLLFLFLILFCFWKMGRSALLGWARLSRLNRLIEEERWEIEHHRSQEKQELREAYQAKGFEGELLDQVVDTLMADDDRLLEVMLTEELGLALESYEHPLKQASGALFGGMFILALIAITYNIESIFVTCLLGLCFLSGSTVSSHLEKIPKLSAFVWNFSLFSSSVYLIYLLKNLFL